MDNNNMNLVKVVCAMMCSVLVTIWVGKMNQQTPNEPEYIYIEVESGILQEENNELKERISTLERVLADIEIKYASQYDKLNKVIEENEKYKEQESKKSKSSSTKKKTNVTQTQQTQAYGVLTKSGGVNYNKNGDKETYYNLNMNGVVNIAKSQGIEGDYWVREDGVKMYGDYVIVAANLDVHPRGSVVETSLGDGIVLDTGGFATSNPTQLDIAVNW